MISYRSLIAISMLSVGAATPAAAQIVNDGGFEWNTVSGYNYSPASSSWYYAPGSGLINGFNTAFNTPSAVSAQGNQFAFLQGHPTYISTSITLPTSGLFSLSFLNAGRGWGCCGGNTIFQAYLDNAQIGQFSTQTGDDWSTKTSQFAANAGTYTLKFAINTGLPTDNAMFIDNVSVAVVATPEPASAALLATGLFSIAGFAGRRKRRA